MKYKNIGKSGLKVSQIALGMMSYGSKKWRNWVLEEDDAEEHIRTALELGINFFDTANMYSLGVSEEITGKYLKKFARREDVVIATKVHFKMSDKPNGRGLSRKHILHEVENSLRRLKTDYIDLYQIHRWDYETPIEETLETLHDLVRAGKVRYIGASSMFAWQFCKSLYLSDLKNWSRFISMQNHYNLVYREEEREMIPLCQEEGIGILPWSPLARGFLTKPNVNQTSRRAKSDTYAHTYYGSDSDFKVLDNVQQLALQKSCTPAQIALAWLLHQPNVTAPIIGTTKITHLKEAVQAIDIQLTKEECHFLEQYYLPKIILGHE